MVGCSVGQTIHRSSVLSIELVRSHHNYMSYCIDNLLCREVKRYGLEPPRVVQSLFSRGHPKHNEWMFDEPLFAGWESAKNFRDTRELAGLVTERDS